MSPKYFWKIWCTSGGSFYSDPGAYFGKATKDYVVGAGAVWVTSPVAAKKVTGMIEKAVQVIQQVLGKTLDENRGQWASIVERAKLEVNRRSIEHLGFSPCEIFLVFQPALELETEYALYHREALQAVMNTDCAFQYDCEKESDCITRFIANREYILRYVHVHSGEAKLQTKERHDLGISEKSFHSEQLVMLYDNTAAGNKLRPRWRGPSVIMGFGGDNGKSYRIRQINGKSIPRTYYGDHLKLFKPREG
ncbi:hypothetical protein OnM2_052067 [Erysiphe neolycopersici]|uniref:Uncharacterized protein n=1 Tax=Erysiphe neolycopersici TaxID=212602 RepID=A0A420HSD7_9PEZI|nr:hypothetical protein OnM2_052067 [Erysiphe neolycopersici]